MAATKKDQLVYVPGKLKGADIGKGIAHSIRRVREVVINKDLSISLIVGDKDKATTLNSRDIYNLSTTTFSVGELVKFPAASNAVNLQNFREKQEKDIYLQELTDVKLDGYWIVEKLTNDGKTLVISNVDNQEQLEVYKEVVYKVEWEPSEKFASTRLGQKEAEQWLKKIKPDWDKWKGIAPSVPVEAVRALTGIHIITQDGDKFTIRTLNKGSKQELKIVGKFKQYKSLAQALATF